MPDGTTRLSGHEALDPVRRHWWTSTLSARYGMDSDLRESRSMDCKIQDRQFGGLLIIDVEMSHQTVSPTLKENASWNGDHLFLKLITHGSISIEQNGNTREFGERSVLLVDPLHPFRECFGERSSFTVLRLPKMALRDRGMPYSFHNLHAGDSSSPDVLAVCDFILLLARQRNLVSSELAERMTDQCFELLDVIAKPASKSGHRRTSATSLVLRAKQVIRQLARDPDLDVSRIARELSVSSNYVSRAFRMCGETPMRYLMSHRLELASRLLLQRHLQVKEVASNCGFVNSSHFCSVFKREFQMSPLDFASTRQLMADSHTNTPSST